MGVGDGEKEFLPRDLELGDSSKLPPWTRPSYQSHQQPNQQLEAEFHEATEHSSY